MVGLPDDFLDCEVFGLEEVCEGASAPLEDGGASAWDSEDFEGLMLDLASPCEDGAATLSSFGSERLLRSSSSSASIPIRVPTLTPFDPSGCYMTSAVSPSIIGVRKEGIP